MVLGIHRPLHFVLLFILSYITSSSSFPSAIEDGQGKSKRRHRFYLILFPTSCPSPPTSKREKKTFLDPCAPLLRLLPAEMVSHPLPRLGYCDSLIQRGELLPSFPFFSLLLALPLHRQAPG